MFAQKIKSVIAVFLGLSLHWGCGASPGKKNADPPSSSPTAPAGSLTVEHAVWAQGGTWQVVGTWIGLPDGPDGKTGNDLDLAFFGVDGSPLTAVKIEEVKPWMTVHGHGTSTKNMVIEPDATAANVIHVKNIRFVMSGPWEIFVTAKSESAPAADRAVIKFNVR